jgi:hypothetical protein
MEKVRFWAFVNGSPVKLTLRRGTEISHGDFWGTEEGWSSERQSWSFDGDDLYRVDETDGVDCDGRLSTWAEYHCPVAQKAGLTSPGYPDIALPEWRPIGMSQRDYAAEAMGY